MTKITFGGLLTVLQELKVNRVIIGKQFEKSENYQKFIEIVKEKNIDVNVVQVNSKINIEKDLYFDVLWPDSKKIVSKNSINNNALVCKLNYKDFSMLFTGDIESDAENILVEKYKNTNTLKATILKVGHHGSKTSSTKEFLELIKPKVALIGVGKNNNFGHPNMQVLQRLQNMRGNHLQN